MRYEWLISSLLGVRWIIDGIGIASDGSFTCQSAQNQDSSYFIEEAVAIELDETQ